MALGALTNQVYKLVILLIMGKQRVLQKIAEFWNITLSGWVGSQHPNHFSWRHIPDFIVQHHYRFRAEQTTGVQLMLHLNIINSLFKQHI